MYNILLFIQYTGIIAAFAGMIYLFSQKISRRKQLLILILMSIIINQTGYLFEMTSASKEAALVSIKVAYAGKLTAELAILIFVLQYSNWKMPGWIKWVLGLLHIFVAGLVWTCESNTLYYSSIEFTEEGLFPHVKLGHGIVYNIFTVVTFSYMAVIFTVCAVRFAKAHTYAQKVRMLCLSTPPVTFVIGLLVFKSGIAKGYDTTALSYLVCSLVFIYTVVKYDLSDEQEIVKEMILDEYSDAVILIDSNGKILYVNQNFKEFCPDYAENSDIISQITNCARDKTELPARDSYYQIISKRIVQEDALLGTMYVINDVTEAHMRMDLIKNYNRNLQYDVELKTRSILEMQDKLVLGMADMVGSRDSSTGGHIKRTSQVVKILIEHMKDDPELNPDDRFCECMIKAAPMHDLGKIAVDDAILRKPGRFTEEEYEKMKEHASQGAAIVHHILETTDDRYFAGIAENVAHYHHERVDGTGYPEHLSGDEIPLEARIMAVADVYDALVSKRCYKDRLPFDKAYEIIIDGMGSQFDKKLEPFFKACRKELENYYAGLDDGD